MIRLFLCAFIAFCSVTLPWQVQAQTEWQNVGVQSAWWDFFSHKASHIKQSVGQHITCLTDAENPGCKTPKRLQIGDSVYDILLPDAENIEWSIGQMQNYKPTLLNVWATWCGPCQAEMPALQALANSGKYSVIALSVDKEAGKAQRFLDVIGADDIRLLSDPFGQKIAGPVLNVKAYPITFLLNRRGVIVARIEGERRWDSPPMLRELKNLLEQSRYR